MRAMANHVDNPWLKVPLADYESHMNSAGVEQSAALSELFAGALARCQPESIAVIGIAGGDGLDHIDSSVTRRVVGIDINPAYLDAVRQRYGQMQGLELMCADLTERFDGCSPVQLVHATLVFERSGTGLCLDNVWRSTRQACGRRLRPAVSTSCARAAAHCLPERHSGWAFSSGPVNVGPVNIGVCSRSSSPSLP
jgi:hypothetical protein